MFKRKKDWEIRFDSLKKKVSGRTSWPEDEEFDREFQDLPSVKKEELVSVVDENFARWKNNAQMGFRRAVRASHEKPDFVRELFKEAGKVEEVPSERG